MLTLEAIKDKITPVCRKYGVKRAYLFGSYARGEATAQSDVACQRPTQPCNRPSGKTFCETRFCCMSMQAKDAQILRIVRV